MQIQASKGMFAAASFWEGRKQVSTDHGRKRGWSTTRRIPPLQLAALAFVRSGKVTGKDRSFTARQREHAECAKLKRAADQSSRFYSSFPSKEVPKFNHNPYTMNKAFFEDLTVFQALGWDLACTEAVAALTNQFGSEGKGLLRWRARHNILFVCLVYNIPSYFVHYEERSLEVPMYDSVSREDQED